MVGHYEAPPVRSILDARVPQVGQEHDYGVPDYVVAAVAGLTLARNECSDADVDVIDAAILRLYAPWTRKGRGE